MREIKEIVIHISASKFGNAERIREWHVNGNGWRDIGYHYVINNGYVFKDDEYEERVADGFIEKGRPDAVAGAHVKGHNRFTIGICLVGSNGKYTTRQIDALFALLKGLMIQYDLKPENVKGHYEYDTANGKTCPDLDMDLLRQKLKLMKD